MFQRRHRLVELVWRTYAVRFVRKEEYGGQWKRLVGVPASSPPRLRPDRGFEWHADNTENGNIPA